MSKKYTTYVDVTFNIEADSPKDAEKKTQKLLKKLQKEDGSIVEWDISKGETFCEADKNDEEE